MDERWRVGLVIAVVLGAGASAWYGFQALQQEAPPAPDFTLVDTGYHDGVFVGAQPFNLSDYRGSTVVLDFMAYNCAACRVVTPDVMDPLYAAYGNRTDFEILTIDVGDFSQFPGSTAENLVKWQTEEYDSPWPHALDTDGIFLDYVALGAIGLPAVFIVDGDGRIVHQDTGIPDGDEMAAVIEASFAGEAATATIVTAGILGLALIAGIASFFAPCSVGLVPAYMGLLLQKAGQPGHEEGAAATTILGAGIRTSAGIVSLYGVLALLLWAVRDALADAIPYLGPVMGGILIALGGLLLLGFDWDRVAKRLGMGRFDGRKGFFVFGVGYGLAAFGCTGPIFLPVLVAGFAEGVGMGLAAFAVYALAVASLIMIAAWLVQAGREGVLRRLLSKTVWITRVSALLLILAGAYLVWFDVTAFA